MEDNYLSFNVNETVKVRLTQRGHALLRMRREELNESIYKRGGTGLGDYEPNEDENGYTTFQMHTFMSTFGEHVRLGTQLLFDVDILIPARHLIQRKPEIK